MSHSNDGHCTRLYTSNQHGPAVYIWYLATLGTFILRKQHTHWQDIPTSTGQHLRACAQSHHKDEE